MTIAADKSIDLYELFAASLWQLGVYSTAIYEGLAFSCHTYILNIPGAELVRPLIDNGMARLVNSAGDLNLDIRSKRSSHSEMFAPTTRENVARVVRQIVQTSTAGDRAARFQPGDGTSDG